MLDRLADYEPSEPLRDFASAIEPIKDWGRAEMEEKAYSQQSPLDRLVDSVPPESPTARTFAQMVDAFLAGDRSYETAIRAKLTVWREQYAKLQPLFKSSALLAENAPVSADLSALAAAGTEALDSLSGHRHVNAGWLAKYHDLLKRAEAHSGKNRAYRAPIIIAVLPPIESLMKAAGK